MMTINLTGSSVVVSWGGTAVILGRLAGPGQAQIVQKALFSSEPNRRQKDSTGLANRAHLEALQNLEPGDC